MMDLFLDWPVDEAGYSLITVGGGPTVAHGNPHLAIVRNGGALRTSEPLKTTALYRKFAEVAGTDDGALAFVNQHGFLVNPESLSPQPVSITTAAAADMRRLMELHEAKDWRALSEILDAGAHSSSVRGVGNLGIVYEWTHGGEDTLPSIKLRPSSLIDAMRVQLLLDMSAGVHLRKCRLPSCTRWFTYGPGTNRRATKFYCTVEHRKAAEYLEKKERKERLERKRGQRQ